MYVVEPDPVDSEDIISKRQAIKILSVVAAQQAVTWAKQATGWAHEYLAGMKLVGASREDLKVAEEDVATREKELAVSVYNLNNAMQAGYQVSGNESLLTSGGL